MLVLFAAVLPVVILFCGLCIDVGILQLRQIQLQSAADAAAIAAEMEAERGTNNWGPAAIYDADINGETIDFGTTSLYADTQPTYGEYMGRYDAMQVTLTQQQSTLFMGALVSGTITLKANAVALLTPCTYLTGSGTLQQYSLDMYSGSYNGNQCPVLINGGLRSQAYSQMSPEAITTTGPASSTSISGFVFPGPAYGAQAFSDPLAAVTSPSFGACSPGHTSAYNLSGVPRPSIPAPIARGSTSPMRRW